MDKNVRKIIGKVIQGNREFPVIERVNKRTFIVTDLSDAREGHDAGFALPNFYFIPTVLHVYGPFIYQERRPEDQAEIKIRKE